MFVAGHSGTTREFDARLAREGGRPRLRNDRLLAPGLSRAAAHASIDVSCVSAVGTDTSSTVYRAAYAVGSP